MVVATELLVILLLLLFNGLLAMSEIAVVSSRRSRLRPMAERGDAGAAAALRLAEEPTRFLSTVQIGITLVGILAGAFGGATLAEEIGQALQDIPPLAPYGEAIGLALVVIGITFLSLIVGELVPKRLALNAPERIAALVARPMQALALITGPLVAVLTATSDGILRLLGARPSGEAAITAEEVRVLIAQGAESGVFEQAERELVESAFELSGTRVGELMTPRPLVVWLNADAPPEANLRVIVEAPHQHYPVCQGDLDHVVGMLSVPDLVAHLLAGQRPNPAELARPSLFIPEYATIFRALEQFRQTRPPVALVIDEHGGTAGLLTATDILEALVGELAPAAGEVSARAVQREDGSWLLDGLLSLDEAAEILGIRPQDRETADFDDVQTLGGLAMAVLGRIPSVGDRFDWHGVHLEVLDLDGRRVDKLLAQPAATGNGLAAPDSAEERRE